jgi:uncharacterized SAM-binding protein YcdF (DUF218 family)
MILLFTKLVSQLVYPLDFSLFLVVVAALLVAFKWKRTAIALIAIAVCWLWIWSAPLTANAIRASLEHRFPPVPMEQTPQADAIVVLGGGVDPIAPPRLYPDLIPGADRVWHAARLFKAGKAPLVILSGGMGLRPNKDTGPESEAMAIFLKDLGVPESALVLESESRNTRENAQLTKKILDERNIKKVLLVTSALHMRSSLALFQKTGIECVPAPTDYEIPNTPTLPFILRILPDARALEGATRAFKEYLGAIF